VSFSLALDLFIKLFLFELGVNGECLVFGRIICGQKFDPEITQIKKIILRRNVTVSTAKMEFLISTALSVVVG
jgi:hypothetical protein